MASPSVRRVSTAVLTPVLEASRTDMTPFDLIFLSVNYIQAGLLFPDVAGAAGRADIVDRLRDSLLTVLREYPPLAGRFAVEKSEDGMVMSIDCGGDSAGVPFVHAVVDGVSVADVAAVNTDVPEVVKSLFYYDGEINHDGHRRPLVTAQVTELADGVFVACSFNHGAGDGASFWSFFNSWSEIARGAAALSKPPVFDRRIGGGVLGNLPIKLPLSFEEDTAVRRRFALPAVREVVFQFSSSSMAALKARANKEMNKTNGGSSPTISSFQALSSLIWRCTTRARRLPEESPTSCFIAMNNRGRLQPPLPESYFGNCVHGLAATATAGDLLAAGGRHGWAASLIGKIVADHTDAAIRREVAAWTEQPAAYTLEDFGGSNIAISCSPRFDVYGCDFGFGKAVAVRGGAANRFDGAVFPYPGREGGGSVDAAVCLAPETMEALLADEEFMSAVSPAPEMLATVNASRAA